MKFKCDNCDGKGKVFYANGKDYEGCEMCNGKGTIGLFFKLIDLYLRMYWGIRGWLIVIKQKIQWLFLR